MNETTFTEMIMFLFGLGLGIVIGMLIFKKKRLKDDGEPKLNDRF